MLMPKKMAQAKESRGGRGEGRDYIGKQHSEFLFAGFKKQGKSGVP